MTFMNSKRAVASMLACGLIGTALVAPVSATPKRKTKTFTVQGEVLTLLPVTHMEFIGSCPSPPATQGLGAYVVEVPADFVPKPSAATVTSSHAASLDPGVDLSFYSSSCEQIDLFESPPTTVPPGTGYIVVEDIRGVGIEFELTLTQR